LTEALLNPELAKTLLMKAMPGNRVFIAQRIGSQLGTLAAAAGAQASGERRSSSKSMQAGPVFVPAGQSPPMAFPIPGALVPGGALMRPMP
jgi:hypothetical protein